MPAAQNSLFDSCGWRVLHFFFVIFLDAPSLCPGNSWLKIDDVSHTSLGPALPTTLHPAACASQVASHSLRRCDLLFLCRCESVSGSKPAARRTERLPSHSYLRFGCPLPSPGSHHAVSTTACSLRASFVERARVWIDASLHATQLVLSFCVLSFLVTCALTPFVRDFAEKWTDAKELKEKLTAWSLKVAEYEHQLKLIDQTQKTIVLREIAEDIRREFPTRPRKLDEIMKKLEIIIINEMLADDGPTSVDLGSVDVHDAGMMQSDKDMSNDTSYEDMCAAGWKGYKAGKGAGKKGPHCPGASHRGKGADKKTAKAAWPRWKKRSDPRPQPHRTRRRRTGAWRSESFGSVKC